MVGLSWRNGRAAATPQNALTMPLIFDSLNLMFLGAVAVFAGGIIKANPDLTKPHPDSAYGQWQAKKQEKVSHEQSSAVASASLRSSGS